MDTSLIIIIVVILIAYAYDFINGFHDAANSIATIVATGVLTPIQAVLWAAFFNFIAFLFFKLSVANMVGTGLIQPHLLTPPLIFAALSSAIVWNLLTWYYGLPSSSSHALIGGLAGAAYLRGGWSALLLSGYSKVLLAIVLSPVLGALIGLGLMLIARKATSKRTQDEKHTLFKYSQLASSAFLSLSHGGNDAQKTMGVITILLFSASLLHGAFYVPFWVVVSCNFVIAAGTFVGGWRIVKTLGKDITYLNTMGGSCAETGSAITISVATYLGIPVSTTHTVTGAIAGVGVSSGWFATRWSVIRKIVYAWFLTLPFTFLLAMGISKVV